VSTPKRKLSTSSERRDGGPARCTLEQLRARWGLLDRGTGGAISRALTSAEAAGMVHVGEVLVWHGMRRERWRVEKIEGKRVDLVQEVTT
jgi:hypothetical protein